MVDRENTTGFSRENVWQDGAICMVAGIFDSVACVFKLHFHAKSH